MRLLIYRSLVRRTPPKAIGGNLADAAALFVPGLVISVPDVTMLRKMRQEATLLGEVCAAYRIASAKRVISFGFDETTKFGEGFASTSRMAKHSPPKRLIVRILSKSSDCNDTVTNAFVLIHPCARRLCVQTYRSRRRQVRSVTRCYAEPSSLRADAPIRLRRQWRASCLRGDGCCSPGAEPSSKRNMARAPGRARSRPSWDTSGWRARWS
eukprot:6571321-Prymnesium_polylepis.1